MGAFCFESSLYTHPVIRESFCLLGEEENKKPKSRRPLQSPKSELLDWSVLFSLVKLVCSECEHRFIDKPTVVTEATVPSARLKGLGSKLYPKTKIFLEYSKSSKWTALRLERCNIHDDDEDMKGGIRNFLLLLLFAEEWLNAWKEHRVYVFGSILPSV